MLNRRKFLTRSASLAAGTTLLSPTIGTASSVLDLAQRRDRGVVDPRTLARSAEFKTLVQKAIDATLAHGASYADVHVSFEFSRYFSFGPTYSAEICNYTIGVRALNNGYWGFASAPWLSDADVVRVAIDAATHAAGFGATRPPRPMEFVPLQHIERNGDWTTPAEIPQYEVDVGEVIDACWSATAYYSRVFSDRYGDGVWSAGAGGGFYLGRTDVVDATSEGSYTVQTFHFGSPGTKAGYKKPTTPIPDVHYVAKDTGIVPSLSPTYGWETYLNLPVEAMFDRWIDVFKQESALPIKPAEVGKYDLLIDWQTMGQLVGATFGLATQLDLALGDHANGVGTSYLGPDVEQYLRSVVAAPNVTLRAERSTTGGAATVKWDSEGTTPREIDIIKDGRLITYQSGREAAGWLRQIPGGKAMPQATSAGFMGQAGGDASDVPLQHLPNFTLAPAANGPDFAELLRSMKKGYVLAGGGASSDFQCLNGVARGRMYEVENGKITAHIVGGDVLFRSPELWSNVIALGGPASARWTKISGRKGEPLQGSSASVSAVPALIKQATVIRGSYEKTEFEAE